VIPRGMVDSSVKLAILTNGDGNDTLTSVSCPFTLNQETVIWQ